MHTRFGVNEVVRALDKEKLQAFLDFRVRFLEEELTELKAAIENRDLENIVDSVVDLLVVGIGTLDAFDVDTQKAWDEVHEANMSKEVGIKPERPNPLGLPDLIKPKGFQPPKHTGNVGLLIRTFGSQCSL
jgi:hypothetical protein